MKDDLRKELEDNSPLHPLLTGDGFAPPHNYFSEFPDRMLAKIHRQQTKSSGSFSWISVFLQPRIAVAFASVILLVVAVLIFRKPAVPAETFVSISQKEAIDYVLSNLHEYDSDDLISAGVLNDLDASFLPVGDASIDDLLEDEALMDEFLMN